MEDGKKKFCTRDERFSAWNKAKDDYIKLFPCLYVQCTYGFQVHV